MCKPSKRTILFAMLNYLGENETPASVLADLFMIYAALPLITGFTADGNSSHHKKSTHILLRCRSVSGEECIISGDPSMG